MMTTIELTAQQIDFLRGAISEYAQMEHLELTQEETLIYNDLEYILAVADDAISRSY